jgi:hypothetical protein
MSFTLDANLDHAAACGAIGKALAAGQITAAEAGAALAAWEKARASGASDRPKFTRTAKGAVYFCWGKSGEGISRSVTTDKAGWEAIGKVAAEIVKQWDKIPLSSTAKLTLENPAEAKRRKDEYKRRKAEKTASAAAA